MPESNPTGEMLISLQTPKADPMLVVKGDEQRKNFYKSHSNKLDRVQTPAHHRAFATVNTREPSNEKNQRKATSKSNSSGKRRSRSSGSKRVSIHHQVPERKTKGIIKKKGKRSQSQRSNYNRTVSSSSSIKDRVR